MRKRILLVDDDSGVCNALAMLLRENGYFVNEATDSAKAEIYIKKNRYDVCLFDYKMKGLNGIDLLRMSKKASPSCPVFIISGVLDVDNLKIKAHLADGIISKPFDVEALLQKIADIPALV